MVFVGLQFAEPASAAKVVDHGTNYVWSGQGHTWIKTTWKAYQYQYKKNGKINNNFIKIYCTSYAKIPETKKYGYSCKDTYTITKVAKNIIKITDWTDSELCPGTTVSYKKTKLTAAQYYWRIYRHLYIDS